MLASPQNCLHRSTQSVHSGQGGDSWQEGASLRQPEGLFPKTLVFAARNEEQQACCLPPPSHLHTLCTNTHKEFTLQQTGCAQPASMGQILNRHRCSRPFPTDGAQVTTKAPHRATSLGWQRDRAEGTSPKGSTWSPQTRRSQGPAADGQFGTASCRQTAVLPRSLARELQK